MLVPALTLLLISNFTLFSVFFLFRYQKPLFDQQITKSENNAYMLIMCIWRLKSKVLSLRWYIFFLLLYQTWINTIVILVVWYFEYILYIWILNFATKLVWLLIELILAAFLGTPFELEPVLNKYFEVWASFDQSSTWVVPVLF